MGGDNPEIVEKRNRMRKLIKANLLAAAASGKDIEETVSDEDGPLDVSEDDFFLSGSSSDEWTDMSGRGHASTTSGKATSGMSSDEKNQKQIAARALLPPPMSHSAKASSLCSSGKDASLGKGMHLSSSNSSQSKNRPSGTGASWKTTTSNSSNLISNSDAHKPRRKRRPKKKKKQN